MATASTIAKLLPLSLVAVCACSALPDASSQDDGSSELRAHPKKPADPGAPPGNDAGVEGGKGTSDSGVSFPVLGDPFTVDATRPTLTAHELQAYVAANDTSDDGTLVGTFEVFTRSRDCGSPCGSWKATNGDVLAPGSYPGNLQPTPKNGSIYTFRKNLVFLAQVPNSGSNVSGPGYFGLLCEAAYAEDGVTLGNACSPNPWFRFARSQQPASPKNLWDTPWSSTFFFFPGELYLGQQQALSGTSHIWFRGPIYRDGTVQLVTETGAANTGQGLHQIAFVGHLEGV